MSLGVPGITLKNTLPPKGKPLLDSSQALNFRRVDVKFGQVKSEPAKLWLDSLACESCRDFCVSVSRIHSILNVLILGNALNTYPLNISMGLWLYIYPQNYI